MAEPILSVSVQWLQLVQDLVSELERVLGLLLEWQLLNELRIEIDPALHI